MAAPAAAAVLMAPWTLLTTGGVLSAASCVVAGEVLDDLRLLRRDARNSGRQLEQRRRVDGE